MKQIALILLDEVDFISNGIGYKFEIILKNGVIWYCNSYTADERALYGKFYSLM